MKRIAVVIVTFNSAQYIRRLIDGVLGQSYPVEQIIISDNNSSDETCSIVCSYQSDKIYLHQLGVNLGGAGGFANGFQIAKDGNFDYILSFDDDAYPSSDRFVADMVIAKEFGCYDVISALVVDSDNHLFSAYEYKIGGKKSTNVADIQKAVLLENDIKLFNGVLFDKKVIEKIGIPDKKLFIRGDEQEYKMRILNAGFKTAVFTAQIVYHPTSVNEYFYIGDRRYHHLDSPFKLFYSTRNQVYITKMRDDIHLFKKVKLIYKYFVQYTWFYLIYRKDIQTYALWLRAFTYGLVGYMKNEFKG